MVAFHYIWNEMDKLESALLKIIRHCSPPTDRRTLKDDKDLIMTQAYCFYYGEHGDIMRQIMPVSDYIELATGPNKSKQIKENKITGSF